MRRLRGKKHPLSSAGLHALRDEYTRTIVPARALAAEARTLERKVKAEGSRLKAKGCKPGDCPGVASRSAPHAHAPALFRLARMPCALRRE